MRKTKRSSQIFHEVSGVFRQYFNGTKNSDVLEPRKGNFRGLEASRPRPRTSKCVLEAKDVLEDSTSVYPLSKDCMVRIDCNAPHNLWVNLLFIYLYQIFVSDATGRGLDIFMRSKAVQ